MIYVWNDIQFRIWYDKQRYMIYNIEVFYTAMIYHMTWYIICTSIVWWIDCIWCSCGTAIKYMIYDIEVWYTDMIYHMTWYIIYTIRYVIYDIW